MFPNSENAVPTVRSDLWRTIITKLFRVVGACLTHLFLKVIVKGVCSGPSQCGRVSLKQQPPRNSPVSPSLCIPPSVLKQGSFSISSFFTVSHLRLHVSPNQHNKQLESFLTPQFGACPIDHTLYLTFRCLGLESSYRSRTKRDDGVLRRSVLSCIITASG